MRRSGAASAIKKKERSLRGRRGPCLPAAHARGVAAHGHGPLVRGSLESARTHKLKHRLLSAPDLRARFPFMRFRPEDVALEEFEAGVLFAEDSVLAMQELANRGTSTYRAEFKLSNLRTREIVWNGEYIVKVRR